MRACFTFLFASLMIASVARAEPLSRGGAIARALQVSPQLAAARAIEAQASARRAQVSAASFPSVSLTLGVGPSLKAKLVPGTADQSTRNTYGDVGWKDLSVAIGGELELLQPLYTFGKLSERAHAADHELAARRAQTEITRAELALTVAQLYEGLLFARDAERFFLEVSHWLERTVQDTQRELDAEAGVREQDLLRLQTAFSAVQLSLHQASAAHVQAEAGLVAYLLFPVGSTIEPKEASLEALPTALPPRAALIERALQGRPELRALAEGSAAFTALARAEDAGNLPDFFALAFASGGYTPGRDVADSRYVRDPLNGFYPGVLVGARWQITGPMAAERAGEVRAKARELQETRRWAAAGMPAEVVKALEDVERAAHDEADAQRAVAAAKRWSVQASADYSVGMGDVRDLTDATQAFVQLRVAAYEANYRHNIALAELARATGGFSAASDNPFYPTHQE
jgi:outer membrane protein TolC